MRKGYQIAIFGPGPSAIFAALTLHVIAKAQQEGNVCLW
jgi:hypothetical protein